MAAKGTCPLNMDESKKRRTMIAYVIVGVLVIVLLNTILAPQLTQPKVTEVPYTQMLEMVDAGEVDEFNYNLSTGALTFSTEAEDGAVAYYTTTYWPNDDSLLTRLEESGATASTTIEQSGNGAMLVYLLTLFLPLLIFIGAGWWINRKLKKQLGDDNPSMSFGGFGQGLGRSGAKIVAEKETGVTFADVAGQDEAKEALTEIVDFLDTTRALRGDRRQAARAARCSSGLPAPARRCSPRPWRARRNVPFFSISGSEFVEMFVGTRRRQGARPVQAGQGEGPLHRVHRRDRHHRQAARHGRASAATTSASRRSTSCSPRWTASTTTRASSCCGATNRPETLDPALLRPGRFDRRIPVELPDLNGRTAILKLHAKNVKMAGAHRLRRHRARHLGRVGRRLGEHRERGRAAGGARGAQGRRPGGPAGVASRWSSPASSARAWCSPTRRSRWWPTTRSATPWSQPSSRTPRRSPRSRSCRAPRARWATPCRSTRTSTS